MTARSRTYARRRAENSAGHIPMLTQSTLLLASLFVIAAACGWAFARYYGRPDSEPEDERLSASYFKGLNYLLNEQPDQALEVFLRIAEIDTDTVATHFALGNLFRRRGEVDRAIRIHQNLLEREELSAEHRGQALLGLGDDFLRSGLFDRAEQMFRQLRQFPTFRITALRRLVSIYEQEQEWQRAIATRRLLQRENVAGQPAVIAHYYCEQAQRAITRKDYEKARDRLRKSRETHRNNPRPVMMRADIARELGDFNLAISLYRQLIDKDPGFVAEILPRLLYCYEESGNAADLNKALEALAKKGSENRQAIAYAAIMDDILDYPIIRDCLHDYLTGNATFQQWFSVFNRSVEQVIEKPGMLEKVARLLRSTSSNGRLYQCHQCGYTGTHLYWQCPSCKQWDTMRPTTGFSIHT